MLMLQTNRGKHDNEKLVNLAEYRKNKTGINRREKMGQIESTR